MDNYYQVENYTRLRDTPFFNFILGYDRDANVLSYDTPKEGDYFFVGMEEYKKIKIGMSRKNLIEVIKDKEDRVKKRFSFKEPFYLKFSKDSYIPIDKFIYYNGGNGDNAGGRYYGGINGDKRSSLGLYFYKDRLLSFYYFLSHLKTNEVIYTNVLENQMGGISSLELELSFRLKAWKQKEDRVSYLRQSIAESYCYTNPAQNHLCNTYGSREKIGKAYWEAPDFEEKLRKSGYYDLKAQLDKDFAEKKGYWAPRNCLLWDTHFCD